MKNYSENVKYLDKFTVRKVQETVATILIGQKKPVPVSPCLRPSLPSLGKKEESQETFAVAPRLLKIIN